MSGGERRIDWSSLWKKEDWWALWLGMLVFVLALPSGFVADVLGWAAKTSVWVDPAEMLKPVSKNYAWLPGIAGLFLLYLFTLIITTAAARVMGYRAGEFAVGYTAIFWLAYACWVAGHYAVVAATPDKWGKYGISWGLSLTGEAGYIFALILGLLIGNLARRLPKPLEAAARPEWYIKTAIVLLGAVVGAKTITAVGVAAEVVVRSLVAIFAAYIVFWPVAYIISRRAGLDRQWSMVLASGVGVCGVSASIATAAAIRAPAIIPVTISSIIVIFAVVELIILPFLASTYLAHVPFAAGAWMGLSVKTDGAAAASGAIVDALIKAKAPQYEGWILATAVTNKIFIDIWIGLMAFILAVYWVYRVEARPGERVPPTELWFRFPKFVIGYIATWVIIYSFIWFFPYEAAVSSSKLITSEANVFRQLFFLLTFFSIGLVTNFRKFAEIGAHRAVLAYAISLLVIIVIALAISIAVFGDLKLPGG